jgi:hypothetical protein
MGKRTEQAAKTKKSAGGSSKATTAPAIPKQQKASKEESAGKKKKTDKGTAQPGSSDGPARAARRPGSASSPFDEDQVSSRLDRSKIPFPFDIPLRAEM